MPPRSSKEDDPIITLSTKFQDLQSQFESQVASFESQYSSMQAAIAQNQDSLSTIMETLCTHFGNLGSSIGPSPSSSSLPTIDNTFNSQNFLPPFSSHSSPPIASCDPSFPRPLPIFANHSNVTVAGPTSFVYCHLSFPYSTTLPSSLPFLSSTVIPPISSSLAPPTPPFPSFPSSQICPLN